jgi:hypothetical protein
VLVVGELNFVLDPDDGGWRVGFDVALKIHVVLQSLAKTRSCHSDHRRKLHLHGNVPAGTLAHSVLGHAVVRATILLADLRDFQNIAPETFHTN